MVLLFIIVHCPSRKRRLDPCPTLCDAECIPGGGVRSHTPPMLDLNVRLALDFNERVKYVMKISKDRCKFYNLPL